MEFLDDPPVRGAGGVLEPEAAPDESDGDGPVTTASAVSAMELSDCEMARVHCPDAVVQGEVAPPHAAIERTTERPVSSVHPVRCLRPRSPD